MTPDFCIKRTDGYVYPYAPAIANRGDMIPFHGSLAEAQAKAAEIVSMNGAESASTKYLGPQDKLGAVPVEKKPDLGSIHQDTRTRGQKIVDAIGRLDPNSRDDYTQGGIPRVEAIENILGDDIEAAERDTAWALYTAAVSED